VVLLPSESRIQKHVPVSDMAAAANRVAVAEIDTLVGPVEAVVDGW
jgi:hypothetical protein